MGSKSKAKTIESATSMDHLADLPSSSKKKMKKNKSLHQSTITEHMSPVTSAEKKKKKSKNVQNSSKINESLQNISVSKNSVFNDSTKFLKETESATPTKKSNMSSNDSPKRSPKIVVDNIVSSSQKNKKNKDHEQSPNISKIKDTPASIKSLFSPLKRKNLETIEPPAIKKSKPSSPVKQVCSEFRFKSGKTFPSAGNMFTSQSQTASPASSVAKKQHTPVLPKAHNSDYSSGSDEEYAENTTLYKTVDKSQEQEESSMEESSESDVEENPLKDDADGSDWTKEQTQEFVQTLMELPDIKKNDQMSFRTRMKTVEIDSVADKLCPSRSKEECQARLQTIISETKTVRTLHEMLAAYDFKPAANKTITRPFSQFMSENKGSIKSAGANYFFTASQLFNAMDPDERYEKYIKPYEEKVKDTKKTAKKGYQTKSAIQFYGADNPDMSVSERRLPYQQLADKRKLKYINMAYELFCKLMSSYQNQSAVRMEATKPPFDKINKDEYKILLRSKGMPVLQYSGPLQCYMTEIKPTQIDEQSSNFDKFRHFHNSKDYTKYCNKYYVMVEECKTNFNNWLQTIDEPILAEKAKISYTELLTHCKKSDDPKQLKLAFKTANKMLVQKIEELETSFVEVSVTATFKNEPAPVPMTAKDCFKKFAKQHVSNNSVSTAKFSSLSDSHKDILAKAAANNLARYKENLKQFAASLSEDQRRIYIGQNRVKFIKMFEAVDIFANDYPVSEYPPFRPPPKESTSAAAEDDSMAFVGLLADLTSASCVDDEEEDDQSARPLSPKQKKKVKETKKKTNSVAASSGKSAAKTTRSMPLVKENREDSMSSEEDGESSSTEDEADEPSLSKQSKSSSHNKVKNFGNIKNSSTKKAAPVQPAVDSSSSESDDSDDESSSGEEEDEVVVKNEASDSSDSDE